MQLSYRAALDMQPGQVLRCSQVAGLILRCRKSERSWWYYYRHNGRQRWLRLGVFPALTVDGAREAARARATAVAKGDDPATARKVARDAPAILELWREYRREHIEKRCGADTVKVYDSYYSAHISRLDRVKVAELRLTDVNRFLARIGNDRPVTANRVRALLWAMMEYAESPDVAYRPHGSNPCKRSIVHPEHRRKRHIRRDEFPAIGDAMRAEAAERPREMAAILCTLLAGSRVTELAKARRWQFDAARGCVVLDDHKTSKRTGEERTIWLPSQAAALIASLPDDGSGYLFGRGLNRFNLRRAWLRVVTAAGCPDVRLQDLRRTFASIAKTRGVGLDAVGELLGHKQRETTGRYAFLFEERAAGIAQETGDALSGLLENKG